MNENEVKIDSQWLFEEIYNITIERQVHDALQVLHPTRDNRLYVCYTFRECSVSFEKALEYFDKYCKWDDYDRNKTKSILGSIYDNSLKDKSLFSKKIHPLFPFKRSIIFSDARSYVDYFVQNYGLPFEKVPLENIQAVFHHISQSRIALPKAKNEKRVWFSNKRGKAKYQWKYGERDYSKVVLTIDDIKSWDYRYGICLIVPTDYRDDCFLDIDMKSEKHKDGVEKEILEEWCRTILLGCFYERTANGGVHIFGKGHPQKPPKYMGLQLVSTLIVTYPTSGYMLPIIGGE